MSSHPNWNPDSNFAKEMRKWDTPRSQGGMKPDGFLRFPAMLYKARRPDSGGPILSVDPRNESFSGSNQMTVNDQGEEERAIREGWRKSPEEAIAFAQSLEDAVSNAAAERQNADKRLSAKARAEAEAVDASTAEHVPEITPQAVRAAKGKR
jgi:hypothetical protein